MRRVVLLSWWLLGALAAGCPQHCRCYTDGDNNKVANCSISALSSGELAPTIDVLNFKHQRGLQTNLEPRAFQYFRGVQTLNLPNATIARLPSEVFHGLSRVVRIDLSFNKIRHLNGVVFKPLPSLKTLSLRGNFLHLSPLEVIVSQTLEELDMGFCSLTNIPVYTFSSAPSLRYLTLDGNFIQVIEHNVLPKGLVYLNLANNQIVNTPINVFNSLRHLLRLDISENPTNCSCQLLVFQDTFSGRPGILDNGAVCANPRSVQGKKISAINENQLCRDDFLTKEGLRAFMNNRKVHHRSNDQGYQSDGPLMGDATAEVIFKNDKTNLMGTHMEERMSNASPDFTDASFEAMQVTPVENDSAGDEDPAQDLTMPDTSLVGSARSTNSDGSSRVENNINLSTSEPNGSFNDHSNTLHVIDLTNNTYDQGPESLLLGDESNYDWMANYTKNGTSEVQSLLESFPDEQTTTVREGGPDKRFAWSTAPTDLTDYSYDAQHADYPAADNPTSAEVHSEGHHESSSQTYELYEGSGDVPLEEVTETSIVSSSTIGFMEERETETEMPLQTVSDDLMVSSTSSADVSSTADSIVEASITESPSSTEQSSQEPIESDVAVFATDPSTEPSEELSSTLATLDASSLEPATELITESSTEPAAEVSSSDPPTEISTEEPSPETPTETSSETTPYSSTSLPELTILEETTVSSSTESSTEVPLIFEAGSASPSDLPSSSSTDPSFSSTQPSTSSESAIISRDWWDSDEVTPSPVSSSTEGEPSRTVEHREGKIIELTTKHSETSDDVELVSTVDGTSHSENIMVSPGQEKSVLTSSIAYIVIGLLVALVIALLAIIVCRRKSTTKKIRLPKDAEAAAGTELQDMLLPKPPENGIKVLPKTYTNGSTPVGNGKAHEPEPESEEIAPVLAPELDEADTSWEDKPEPIEAVTARLTMLARPQTPIFIQKSQT